jgi:flagellar hook-basal body complex protein FliE
MAGALFTDRDVTMNPISSLPPQFPGPYPLSSQFGATGAAGELTGKMSSAPGGVSFQDLLLQSMQQVNELDRQSQSAVAGALTDGDLTQAEVLTSVRKADLAFRTMLQIRNKVLEAYNELMQMRM